MVCWVEMIQVWRGGGGGRERRGRREGEEEGREGGEGGGWLVTSPMPLHKVLFQTGLRTRAPSDVIRHYSSNLQASEAFAPHVSDSSRITR